MMRKSNRTRAFEKREHNRYWWYRDPANNYVPPLFSRLSDDEWSVVSAWFEETERLFAGPGEAGVPCLSFLEGLVGGNGLGRIVQCGHYAGFSTLMLGMLLRSMGKANSLISFDIDADMTAYTQRWVDRAQLQKQVKLVVGDSADDSNALTASSWLGAPPQLVFIDSSHRHGHTLRELDLWYEALGAGGLIILHDVSAFAATFDDTKEGGVGLAVEQWCSTRGAHSFLVNRTVVGALPESRAYADGCGIGLIQKPT